jgi:hypothetical protein
MGILYTGDHPNGPASNIWAIDMTILLYREKIYAIWSGWINQETTDATPQHLYISEMEAVPMFTELAIARLLSHPTIQRIG